MSPGNWDPKEASFTQFTHRVRTQRMTEGWKGISQKPEDVLGQKQMS